jgi:hypothetical protein
MKMQVRRCKQPRAYRGQRLPGSVKLIDLAHATVSHGRQTETLACTMGAITLMVAAGVIATPRIQPTELSKFVA